MKIGLGRGRKLEEAELSVGLNFGKKKGKSLCLFSLPSHQNEEMSFITKNPLMMCD